MSRQATGNRDQIYLHLGQISGRALVCQQSGRMLLGITAVALLFGGCSMDDHPYPPSLNGQDAVEFIDSLRPAGSYEQARVRLNATAARISERIVEEFPGQTWRLDAESLVFNAGGLACTELAGDVALRPMTDSVLYGRPFTAEEFPRAAEIVRQEAAPYGIDQDSTLFNDDFRRDITFSGHRFEFNLGQGTQAVLNITGSCFLLQHVINQPAG